MRPNQETKLRLSSPFPRPRTSVSAKCLLLFRFLTEKLAARRRYTTTIS